MSGKEPRTKIQEPNKSEIIPMVIGTKFESFLHINEAALFIVTCRVPPFLLAVHPDPASIQIVFKSKTRSWLIHNLIFYIYWAGVIARGLYYHPNYQ